MYGDRLLGEKIRDLRKKLGITQKEMADELSVTQSYISKIETAEAMPNVEFIKEIRIQYKINLNTLLAQ
jgi:transcriptional regulator with XRE-family HTH domain